MHQEQHYLNLFLEPLRRSKDYKPKFGGGLAGKAFSLGEFLDLYGGDPFYAWVGLNSELMYAAHKAAGGMTSVYRQIGVGCEHLFRAVLSDAAGYAAPEDVLWSYTSLTKAGTEKVLSMDARLAFDKITNKAVSERLKKWLSFYCTEILSASTPMNGVVFEVRQGYKSKDSKRQNADLDNATVAWANGYLPVFALFSGQIDADLVLRYRNNRCGILTGDVNNGPYISLFAFSEQVLGYDLASFFERNTKTIKDEVQTILTTLLKPNGTST